MLYKAILPKPKMDQLLFFVEFLKKRLQGILFCQVAIVQKKLGESDLDRVMITQRSIYLLKRKVLALEDLLEKKGKLSPASKAQIAKDWNKLEDPKKKELYEAALLYLHKEDSHALHWREKHLQGIVGTKYSTSTFIQASKTLATKSISWLLSKEPEVKKDSEEKESPPGLLEIPPSALSVAQQEIPPVSSAEEIPPVASSSEEQEEDAWDELEKTGDFSVVSYEESPAPISPLKIAFVLTGIFVALFFFFFYYSEDKEAKLVSEIQHLLENKKYQESEEKCVEFRKKYPLSKNTLKVTETLQELLMKRADIYFRQDRLSEAKDLLIEALNLQKKGQKVIPIQTFLQEVEKQVSERNAKDLWLKEEQNFKNALQREDLDLAANLLQWLQANASESAFLEKVTIFSQDLQKAQEKNSLSQYCYSPKESLPSAFSFVALPSSQKNIMRMALSGEEIGYEIPEATGYFFTIAAGHLYALHARDGKIAWVSYLGGESGFAPVFLYGNREYFNMNLVERILVVIPGDNSLCMIQSQTGEKLWETKLPGLIATRPVLYKDKVYLACLDRYCYRLDVATGLLEGAYLSGEIALFAPSFDKKKQLMYLPCTEKIYAYSMNTGKLLFTIPTPKGIATELICVGPYLVATTSQKEVSHIHFYLVEEKDSQMQASFVKETSLPGTIQNLPSLAGGILAVLTDTHLGCYGIHATNYQEVFFPLGPEGGVALESKKNGFVLFSNFLRNLIVAQGDLGIYAFQDMESSVKPPVKVQNYRDKSEKQMETYQPLQRNGNLLFWARKGENNHYWLTCVNSDKQGITPLWQKQIAPCITASPLKTPEGRLLFPTQEGNLHEVYLSSEDKLCYRIFSSSKTESRSLVYIPEEQGRILVEGKKNALHLLDAVTGMPQTWQADIPAQGEIGKFLYASNNIFAGTETGVFAFSAQSGKKTYLEFSEFRGKPFLSGLAFSQNSVFAGSDNGILYQLALTKASPFPYLEKVWSFETQGPIRSDFLLHENHLYFGSDDQFLYKISLESKKLSWKYKTKGALRNMPILHENMLFFSTEQRYLYAIEAATGQPLWEKHLSGKSPGSPLYHKGILYIATLAGEFYAYNAKTGKEIMQTQLVSPIYSSPVTLGNLILLGASDGFIYIIKELY